MLTRTPANTHITALCTHHAFYSAPNSVTVQTMQCNVQKQGESVHRSWSADRFNPSMRKYMSQTVNIWTVLLSVHMGAEFRFLLFCIDSLLPSIIFTLHPSNCIHMKCPEKEGRVSDSSSFGFYWHDINYIKVTSHIFLHSQSNIFFTCTFFWFIRFF